jgi:hypothetical protein
VGEKVRKINRWEMDECVGWLEEREGDFRFESSDLKGETKFKVQF